MNQIEAGLILNTKPTIQTAENIKSTSFEEGHLLQGHPNVIRWYSTDVSNNVSDIYFYNEELCKAKYSNGTQLGFMTYYDIQLINVRKPENVKKAFSEIKFIDIPNQQNKGYDYEDEYLNIRWIPLVDCFEFNIQNKCNYSIKLSWDNMAFVDKNGQSKRLLNGETRKINSDREQPNSVVPRNAKLSGYAVPYPQNKFFNFEYFSPLELKEMGCIYRGQKISILFPVIIQNIVNEYVFEFEVKDTFVLPI